MNKITISDIDNSIDDIYNTQINITNVKLYIDSAIITDLFNGYQRYKAAMLRHLLEYEKGNKVDDETKVNHLAAVAWNAIAMLYLDKHGKGKGYDIK